MHEQKLQWCLVIFGEDGEFPVAIIVFVVTPLTPVDKGGVSSARFQVSIMTEMGLVWSDDRDAGNVCSALSLPAVDGLL